MKQKIYHAFAVALAALVGVSSASAASTGMNVDPKSPLGKSIEALHHGRQLRGHKGLRVTDLSSNIPGPSRMAPVKPSFTFDDLPLFDYLEGPDGSVWYYTVEYEVEEIVHNEYWTESVLKAYTFDIYDNQFNLVGSIHDDVQVLETETGAREILIDPTITSRFYNDDENYEVMIYHVMNTPEYINHYYYKVYSIGGKINEDGNDECIAIMEGRCADAINIGGDGADENFLLTFVHDPRLRPKSEFRDGHEYIDYLNQQEYTLVTYSKSVDGEAPAEFTRKGIGITRVPGDTTDGIYFISKKEGDSSYFIYSFYEKPYLIEPVLVDGNENATPDNSFVIETYQINGEAPSLVATTVIPIDYPDSSEQLTLAYYSIGSVAWSDDVDMSVNGSPSAPAFIVAHDIEVIPTESFTSNYEIYDVEGRLVRTIASDTENIALLRAEGEQPHLFFIVNQDEEYIFRFVNLYDGQERFSLPQQNGGDPLYASVAPVKDYDGNLFYVFQMQQDEIDGDTDHQYIRAAWFDGKGELDHIDRIHVGQNVQLAQINFDPASLHPDIYDEDDEMEYAVLVKRTYGHTTRNEFLVVDNDGEYYATFTADDGRGDPFMFTFLPGSTNRILMAYGTATGYSINVDLYDLPFLAKPDLSGVESIESAAVESEEGPVRFYNLQGMEVSNPQPGDILIRKSATKSSKVIIK